MEGIYVVELNSKVLHPVPGHHNLANYEKERDIFSWETASRRLSFWKTGKVNVAYETIDRHVDEGYGDKVALHYVNENEKIALTFREIKDRTDHYANVLKKQGVQKGERVFVFLPKTPECYISILAIIKMGAIAAPLFEAFMADAVKDRMNDCQGTTLITDEEMYKRVPKEDIPSLKRVLMVADIENENYQSENNQNLIEWVDLNYGLIINYTSGLTCITIGVL